MEKSPFRDKKTGGLFLLLNVFFSLRFIRYILHGSFIMSIPQRRNNK